jgi:hypothetical protein
MTLRAAIAIALVVGCIGPPAHVPSAVVALDPGSVCQGDDLRSVIVVDGSLSSTRLSLVPVAPEPGEPPLAFEWSFSGAAVEIVGGTVTSERLEIRTTGDRPVHVTLRVTNGDGAVAETLRTLPITVPEVGVCAVDGECLEGERCDGGICVPDHPCAEDRECEVCFVCDAARSTCVPRDG